MGISFTHLLLLAIILLLFFGPKRLPEVGKSIGKAVKGFKDAMNEVDAEAHEIANDTEKSQLKSEQKESQKS